MHYVSEGVAVQIVFPVRYVSEDVAVQTTSRELSASGIGVRSLAPPQVGAHVLHTLYLPNAGAPEMAVGRVARRRADQPADAGFWAAFLVVDPQARMRISQLLAEQHDPNEHDRGLERHPVKLQVRFGSAREFVIEYATNLSRSGIFVGCDDPPPLDTAVEVRAFPPKNAADISLTDESSSPEARRTASSSRR